MVTLKSNNPTSRMGNEAAGLKSPKRRARKACETPVGDRGSGQMPGSFPMPMLQEDLAVPLARMSRLKPIRADLSCV